MFNTILNTYGLSPDIFQVSPFGTGLINRTWKVSDGNKQFILQLINTQVFNKPQDIAENIEKIAIYLKKHSPEYSFVSPINTIDGKSLYFDDQGGCYRMFPFVENSHTIDTIDHPKQGYEAAKQFGTFTSLLKDFDVDQLKYTITDFHNLSLRYDQFKTAHANASQDLLTAAAATIEEVERHAHIVETYRQLLQSGEIKTRVIHHDTKISNVLLDSDDLGICVIDLDTVMPGLYISDVGDMLRTYLSPVSEEETDLVKIMVRNDFFKAIYQGYMKDMGTILSPTEKSYFLFAGKFMIYMQAIRFLTDFLNKDIYYQVKYPGHNLCRAKNQINFLKKYIAKESELQEIIDQESSILEFTQPN